MFHKHLLLQILCYLLCICVFYPLESSCYPHHTWIHPQPEFQLFLSECLSPKTKEQETQKGNYCWTLQHYCTISRTLWYHENVPHATTVSLGFIYLDFSDPLSSILWSLNAYGYKGNLSSTLEMYECFGCLNENELPALSVYMLNLCFYPQSGVGSALEISTAIQPEDIHEAMRRYHHCIGPFSSHIVSVFRMDTFLPHACT